MLPTLPADAVSKVAAGEPKTVIKAAVLTYLASFLDERGANRQLLRFACPAVANMFDAGTWSGRAEAKDPLMQRMQLAKMFDGTGATLPSVLITDSGAVFNPANLGSYDTAYRDPKTGFNVLRVTNTVDMSLTVAVGAGDLTTCDQIASALGMALGPLARLAGGHHITHKAHGGNWEIVLPTMQPISIPPAGHTPYDGDTRKGMYLTQIDISGSKFESSLWFKYKQPTERLKAPLKFWENPEDPDHNVPALRYSEDMQFTPRILPVTGLKVGKYVDLTINYKPEGSIVTVEDPRILTVVDSGRRLMGRNDGTTKINLIWPHGPTNAADRLIDQRTVTVEWR